MRESGEFSDLPSDEGRKKVAATLAAKGRVVRR